MKTGLTIQQMAQELLRQSKAKQDYLVNTGSLSLSVTSDAPQLRVTENGLDIGEGDSICEISHELVLDNWQSVPHTIPHECPFRWQIIRQRRKAVRRK